MYTYHYYKHGYVLKFILLSSWDTIDNASQPPGLIYSVEITALVVFRWKRSARIILKRLTRSLRLRPFGLEGPGHLCQYCVQSTSIRNPVV
ncbi:uncharacterized protein N7446_009720 [Penicillium canescens]|uniref:uncharacterized protein n=1 Tax=Penicillium canescens TaxID=5083 RepID=UPI0026E03274|nr:uncharacterized protein N7446_009720 [Penicillium canescens]KAJ6046624.1 hypothetical protein N7444_007878 [Penicillium canescens]KAJ6053708.1 hypothetical protein N7446_009720 [Penicillium canescens]